MKSLYHLTQGIRRRLTYLPFRILFPSSRNVVYVGNVEVNLRSKT
jgi:hypothetical protein